MRTLRMFLVIGSVSVGAGMIAAILVASVRDLTASPQAARHDGALLAARVASAREIRAALAKPLPPIEPLPPISTKVARAPVPAEALDAYAQEPRPRPPRKVPIEVRDALARAEWNDLVRSAQSERSGRSWRY